MSSWLLIPKINHTYIWFEPCVCIRLKNDWTRALCVKIRFVLMIGKWLRFCSPSDNASALSFLPLVHLKASLPPRCHRHHHHHHHRHHHSITVLTSHLKASLPPRCNRHRHHHHEKRWKLFFLIVHNILNKQCRVHIWHMHLCVCVCQCAPQVSGIFVIVFVSICLLLGHVVQVIIGWTQSNRSD